MTDKAILSKSPAMGILRLTQEQVEQAIQELKAFDADPDKVLFEVRKCCKRARAGFRLIHKEAGTKRYCQENQQLRDVARLFSLLRDAKVFILTLDQIRAIPEITVSLEEFKQIYQAFESYYQTVYKVVQNQNIQTTSLALLKKSLSRLKHWKITNDGWEGIGPGIKRTYDSGYKSFKKVQKCHSMEQLHEWRKQTKYLWYQLSYLRPIFDKQSWELYQQFQMLSKLLGQEHDWAILQQAIQKPIIALLQVPPIMQLLHFIDQQRALLQAKAFQLGNQIYSYKPGRFVKRLKEHFQDRQHS